jgi:hypothetical protein
LSEWEIISILIVNLYLNVRILIRDWLQKKWVGAKICLKQYFVIHLDKFQNLSTLYQFIFMSFLLFSFLFYFEIKNSLKLNFWLTTLRTNILIFYWNFYFISIAIFQTLNIFMKNLWVSYEIIFSILIK